MPVDAGVCSRVSCGGRAAQCLAGLMETALFAGLIVIPKPGQFSRWNCSVETPLQLAHSPDAALPERRRRSRRRAPENLLPFQTGLSELQ